MENRTKNNFILSVRKINTLFAQYYYAHEGRTFFNALIVDIWKVRVTNELLNIIFLT